MAYCKYINKKVPLRFKERKPKALELHKEMYTAFAAYVSLPQILIHIHIQKQNLTLSSIHSGDVNALRKICCSGLIQTFQARISRRPKSSPELIWTLHNYIKFPKTLTFSKAKVISDRAAAIPGQDGTGVRQVIVRIQSRQSLIKPAAISPRSPTAKVEQSEEIKQQMEEKQQDCTEYVVIQRMMWAGRDGEWKIWGMADETTVHELDTNPYFAPGMSIGDKISSMASK